MVVRFLEDSETRVFLLSTRAGGLGLNLQVCDVTTDMPTHPTMNAK